MRGGCPDPMSRWWWGATGSECDPGPGTLWLGPAVRVPLQATSPERPRARAGLGARKRHRKAGPRGRPRALPFGKARASVQREAGWGFCPFQSSDPPIWGLGLFTQSQVTFEVEELVSYEEGTRTDLVVTPLPLTPFGCHRVWGRGKERAHGDGEGTRM